MITAVWWHEQWSLIDWLVLDISNLTKIDNYKDHGPRDIHCRVYRDVLGEEQTSMTEEQVDKMALVTYSDAPPDPFLSCGAFIV